VLTRNATDPEHAFDPQTGQNFNWDPATSKWVDSATGKGYAFFGYLSTTPPSQSPPTTPAIAAGTAPATPALPAAPQAQPSAPSSPGTSTGPGEYFNPQTGETATIDPGQTAPAGWTLLQFPPPVAQPGSPVTYLPGQGPQLYANPSTGQSQWTLTCSNPPSGWIKLLPALSSAPVLPSSLMPPANSSTTAGANSPATPPQTQTTKQPSSDYGSGGHSEQDTNMASGVLEGRVYDTNNSLRDDTTYQYATSNGKPVKTSSTLWDFDSGHHLSFTLGLKYDFRGDLTSTDITHYGLHGERTSEEITNYHSTGYEIRDWKIGTHLWSTEFDTYKLPATTGSSTSPQTPIMPGNTSIGVLFPRDFHPGDTITGSLWPSSYADNFKTVPGLSEYDFPIESYSLPDGSPEWCRFRIGVPGYGYSPVLANGTFSVHIPLDWKGPLTLQALQTDPVPNLGPTTATLQIGNPVAAPTLGSSYFPAQAQSHLDLWTKYHLIDLWDEADYMEDMLDDEYDATNPDWDLIADMEDYLDGLYGEIDYVESKIPPSELEALLNPFHLYADTYDTWLGKQPNLTSDQQTDLKYSTHWSNFLSHEIDNTNWLSTWNSPSVFQPYWTNPVLTMGKLGALRGDFSYDPLDTSIRIDNFPLTPIGATSTEDYFMPPDGLTAGLHNYYIHSPLSGETVFPEFFMTLEMGAGQLNLHKGQSTTYFARLNIFNGSNSLFPSLFDGPPLYETDIIGSSELTTNQQAAPASRTGFITFSVTNQSANITMKNEFRLLNASNFVPSGSYEIDGGITAIKDGNFTILGVARANLAPEGGLGSTPGSSSPSQGYSMTNWLPPFNISYNPTALSSSPFMTDCSAPAATPTTAAQGASTPGLLTTTPGAPATTPTTTTPSTPAGASNPSDCPPAALIDLYNNATGSPSTSVPVGNPPDTSEIDAAKKRVADARTALSESAAHLYKTENEMVAAWDQALSNVPASVQQAVQAEFSRLQGQITSATNTKEDLRIKYKKNPTQENLTYFNAANADLQRAIDACEAFKKWVIDNLFSPQGRAAYQAAVDAVNKAREALDNASAILRSAQSDLERATQSATTK
jgi:hypothetical protein